MRMECMEAVPKDELPQDTGPPQAEREDQSRLQSLQEIQGYHTQWSATPGSGLGQQGDVAKMLYQVKVPIKASLKLSSLLYRYPGGDPDTNPI